MNILLIGGAGYIGARLTKALERRGHRCSVIDPRILQEDPGLPFPCEIYDVRRWEMGSAGEPQGPNSKIRRPDVVIWLASIHEVPDERRLKWQDIAYELMVDRPMDWARATQDAGGRFFYISSTRAGTHTNRLYGWNKRRFEEIRPSGVTVVRPGTVWGALSATLPNRTQTIVNRMLLEPTWDPEPRDEPFFTCHYPLLERVLCDLVKEPDHCWSGLVVPVTDTVLPVTGAKLAGGWRPKGFSYEKVPFEALDPTEHPMKLYEKYYFPEESCAST